jgi:multidrug efflux pump subunit AcrA (membrane-fusion protein)
MKKACILICILLSACTQAAVDVPPPTLLEPVSVKADTALVVRGSIERVEQYRSFVRVRSEGLFFRDTGLRFGAYLVEPGERVAAGQLLAVLDTERLEKQIEEQMERLAQLRREQYFEAELLALDIDIARAELVAVMRAESFNEQTMEAADRKKNDIERAELTLSQALERQALTYQHSQVYLNELLDRMAQAELRAPYDGVITLRVPKTKGDFVEPFASLVYLSDETSFLLEYVGDEGLSISRGHVVKAYFGDKAYDVERMLLSRQEALFYSSRMMVSPLRLTTVDPDAVLPPPGTLMNFYVYNGVSEDTLYIPSNALFHDMEIGHYVYRMENAGKIPVEVEVGIITDVFVEITHGLREGDELYVRP